MKALIKSEMSADLTDQLEEILPRLKFKYRQEFKDAGRLDLPGQDELPFEQPIETVSAPPEAPAPTVDEPPAPPEQPQAEPLNSAQQAADAALALQRQIDELKKSEAMQREQAAVLQQPQPVTREQKLALWRQTGMSEEEAHFLQQNPEMIDHPQLTGFAVSQAQQAGHQRGTKEFSDAVKKIFDANFNRLQGKAEDPAMQSTPKFFQPPPPPAAPKEAHIVSAPVSRHVPGVTRPRGRVTLSREEQEAARMSGLTLEEYAMQKRKYQDMRESGEYRDERR